MTQTKNIRRIEKSDVGALLRMMQALASHEDLSDVLSTDEEKLQTDGFSDPPRWSGLILEVGGVPCGFATWVEEYHIWSGAPVIRLDDLYIDPDHRSAGYGEDLMREVFQLAQAIGTFVTWSVRTENKRAIAFYERLGARVDIQGKCIWRAGAV